MNNVIEVNFSHKPNVSGPLKLAALLAVPIAVCAGFLFYTSTDSAAYPMRDDALQAAVLAKFEPRLKALGVSRMAWSACRMDNPVTTESKFAISTGEYRFGPSGDYETCDGTGRFTQARWAFVLERSSDGSYRMLMHDIDHDVPFAAYRDAAIASARAALSQLDQQLQSDQAAAQQRANAQASWPAPTHS